MIVIMLVSGLAAAVVKMFSFFVCRPMRLASGVLLWSLRLVPLPRRTLRSTAELEDGREYEFRCRGSKTRRTFFSDPARAKSDDREAFTLGEQDGLPGIQCWQKRYPDGRPVGPGVGCWTTLNLFFGKRARKDPWGIRLRRVA